MIYFVYTYYNLVKLKMDVTYGLLKCDVKYLQGGWKVPIHGTKGILVNFNSRGNLLKVISLKSCTI